MCKTKIYLFEKGKINLFQLPDIEKRFIIENENNEWEKTKMESVQFCIGTVIINLKFFALWGYCVVIVYTAEQKYH